MLLKIRSILYFYRGFVLASLLINILLFFFNIILAVAVIIKLLFLGLILYDYLNSKFKNKLTFYHNLSISTFFLFGTSFLLDVLLLYGFYKILGYAF